MVRREGRFTSCICMGLFIPTSYLANSTWQPDHCGSLQFPRALKSESSTLAFWSNAGYPPHGVRCIFVQEKDTVKEFNIRSDALNINF